MTENKLIPIMLRDRNELHYMPEHSDGWYHPYSQNCGCGPKVEPLYDSIGGPDSKVITHNIFRSVVTGSIRRERMEKNEQEAI